MKNKKILISLIVLTLLLISCFTVNIFAAESQVLINNDSATFYITIEGYPSWKEYIDSNPDLGFSYTTSYVYYGEKRLGVEDSDRQGILFVHPERMVIDYDTYICVECDHDYIFQLQVGRYPCQEITRYYRCESCGYKHSESYEPNAEHQFGIDLSTYIPATCSSPGYERYVCSACGMYDSSRETAIDPLGHIFVGGTCISPAICTECGVEGDESLYKHNWQEATCTEPEFCLDCKKVGKDSALGHDLNKIGGCKRVGCHYNKYFNNVGTSVNKVITNTKETIKEIFVGGEDSEGIFSGAAKVFKIGFMIVSILLIISFVMLVLPYVIRIANKFKGHINEMPKEKKTRRRRKRKRGNK